MQRNKSFIKYFLLISIFFSNNLFAQMIIDFKAQSLAAVKTANHALWDSWLRQYVSEDGSVNYSGGKLKSGQIEKYLKTMLSIDPKKLGSRNEKLAYYINLYNAATVYAVLKRIPIKSVMHDIPDSGFFKAGFYLHNKLTSLNDLENKIIRPLFKDARIHFALNCASKSCPKLMNRSFQANTLIRDLNRQTRVYLSNSMYAKYSENENKLYLVELFKWYREDFENLVAFYNKFTDSSVPESVQIVFTQYDWALNGK